MKNLFTTLLILMLSFSVNSQTKAISYPDTGLIAAFPVPPVIDKNEVESQVGKIKLVTYQSEGEESMVLVSRNEFTKDAAEKLGANGAKGVIDGSINGAIKNMESQMGAKYVSETNEDFLFNGKYTANKSTGNIDGTGLQTLCIMKENYLYVVIAMGNTASLEVTNFFKTFNLIEK